MTMEDFCKELFKSKLIFRSYKLSKITTIRTTLGLCPIIALYNLKNNTCLDKSANLEAYDYGIKLGLSPRNILIIVRMMDDTTDLSDDDMKLINKLIGA